MYFPLYITQGGSFSYIGTSIKKIKFDCHFSDLLYLIAIFTLGKKKIYIIYKP